MKIHPHLKACEISVGKKGNRNEKRFLETSEANKDISKKNNNENCEN